MGVSAPAESSLRTPVNDPQREQLRQKDTTTFKPLSSTRIEPFQIFKHEGTTSMNIHQLIITQT